MTAGHHVRSHPDVVSCANGMLVVLAISYTSSTEPTNEDGRTGTLFDDGGPIPAYHTGALGEFVFRVRRYPTDPETPSPLVRLLHNLFRIFVIPERDELRVAQMIRSGPLEEIDPHNNLGLEP